MKTQQEIEQRIQEILGAKRTNIKDLRGEGK